MHICVYIYIYIHIYIIGYMLYVIYMYVYIYIYIYIHKGASRERAAESAPTARRAALSATPRFWISEGFASSMFLISRGGSPRSAGNSPEIKARRFLVCGCLLCRLTARTRPRSARARVPPCLRPLVCYYVYCYCYLLFVFLCYACLLFMLFCGCSCCLSAPWRSSASASR